MNNYSRLIIDLEELSYKIMNHTKIANIELLKMESLFLTKYMYSYLYTSYSCELVKYE